MHASKVIARYLREQGIKQSDFAIRLNVTPGLVSQWLSGKTAITPRRALQIEEKTGGVISRQKLLPEFFRGAA